MYLPKGSNLIMVDLVPMLAPSQVTVSIQLRALEHKSKGTTVKHFKPKLKRVTMARHQDDDIGMEQKEENHLRQKISLPEHFASCEIDVLVTEEEKGGEAPKSLTYTVKLHVGEY